MDKSKLFVLEYGIGNKSHAVNTMETWLNDQRDLYGKKRAGDVLILDVFDDEEAAYKKWLEYEPHCTLAVEVLEEIRRRKGKKS